MYLAGQCRAAWFMGCVGCLLLSASVLSPNPALAREKPTPIPFEEERAARRGDKVVLRLHDDASRIPPSRIRNLPVVNGRLGDRADLEGGLRVYFPFGKIVLAEATFRTDPDLDRAETDADFRAVASFDKVLGPVCASEAGLLGQGSRLDMRMNGRRTISLVSIRPVPNESTPWRNDLSYRVVTAAHIRHLKDEPRSEALHKACSRPRGKPAEVRAVVPKTPPPGRRG